MRTSHNFVDLTGQRFGKRFVVKREANCIYNGKQGNSRWLVRCDCGKENIVDSNSVKKGKSCGCDKEAAIKSGLKRRKDIKAPKNEGHLRRTFGLSIEQFN